MKKNIIRDISGIAFDLDGTVYEGSSLCPGAKATVEHFTKKGAGIFFFTNNSAKTRVEIREKLVKLGIEAEISRIYSSAYAAGVYLKRRKFSPIYCLGTAGLKNELSCAGIECLEKTSDRAKAVIVGMDPGFDYEKLAAALNVVNKTGAPIIACNLDRNYAVEDGRIMPGCGPIAAALEFAAGRKIDAVVGKPEGFMLDLLCEDWNVGIKKMLIVGDTYDSDIAMAKRKGCKSVLISSKTPDKSIVVIRQIDELIKCVRV